MRKRAARRAWTVSIAIVLTLVCRQAQAGSIFLTGHDSDFHAAVPPEFDGEEHHNNAVGARRLNQTAIGFIMDPLFNPFFAAGIEKFLFVEADEADANLQYSPLLGKTGIVASGYVEGTDFDQRGAASLLPALDQLGTMYSAIVVASDCGGSLRQQELDILNSRSAAIIEFLNAGGGLFAMAESNLCGPPSDPTNGITPGGGHFGFLPFITSFMLNVDEDDPAYAVELSAYGRGLGLTQGDVTGNFSHNVFGGTYGMHVVDSLMLDGRRVPLSLATRRAVDENGVIPEPGVLALLGFGTALVAVRARRRRCDRT